MSDMYKDEIWKPIKNYVGYFVSNCGRIKSFKRNKEGKILKTNKNKYGYIKVVLCENKKNKTFLVHRLVSLEFIHNPNIEEFIQVNHIDENKQNNHVDNLEWCTRQYNVEYSHSKKYRILFPDGHEEIIFNLEKFCRENNIIRSCMHKSLIKGHDHKGYKTLEKIEKNGNIQKAKKIYHREYKIQFLDKEVETIFNLTNFCKENDLNIACMCRTFNIGCFHKGYKLIEKMERDGTITKAPNI